MRGSSPYSEMTHSRIAFEITNQENEHRSQSTVPPGCVQAFIKDLDKEMGVKTTKLLKCQNQDSEKLEQ